MGGVLGLGLPSCDTSPLPGGFANVTAAPVTHVVPRSAREVPRQPVRVRKVARPAARAAAVSSAPAVAGSDEVELVAAAPAATSTPGVCPADMEHVSGRYCLDAEQRCLSYVVHQGVEDKTRCAEFAKSVCLPTSSRRAMDFCMDRHEYPNTPGELPMTLVDWGTAAQLCEKQGKRLCTESEFTFACEGEEMLAYTTGSSREPERCNIDQPFLAKRVSMLPEAECAASDKCAKEMARLDRRRRIGEDKGCVSPFGIHDLNGNANEWVTQPGHRAPRRAALKGGWWGPVRNRCRAVVSSHHEDYVGYEVGFRCCRDTQSKAL